MSFSFQKRPGFFHECTRIRFQLKNLLLAQPSFSTKFHGGMVILHEANNGLNNRPLSLFKFCNHIFNVFVFVFFVSSVVHKMPS